MQRKALIIKYATLLAGAVVLAAGAYAQEEPASATARNNRPITVHVIGFDVDQATADQLSAMAQAGGGRYFPADDEAQLVSALGSAAGINMQPTLANEAEGNNSMGIANRINPSGAVSGSIDPAGDTDYYMIEIDEPGTLEFSVTNVPANVAAMVRVYNQERGVHVNWVNPLRAGAETTGVAHLPYPGKWYIQIADATGKEAAAQAVTLTTQFYPGDAFELNNSFGTAVQIAPDDQLYASILPLGDQDWFTFEIQRRGALHVSVTESPAETDLIFRVYNAEASVHANWIAPLRAGADNIAVVDLPYDGRWYLQITDSGDDAYSPQNYNLQLKFEPGDDFEANETIGRATKIDATSQQMATIMPRGDNDFFYFDVDHPGAVDVRLDNVPANIDLHARVYNAERGVHLNWIAPLRTGAENHFTIDLPRAGRYYLQIVDGKDDERSADPYTLSLSYTAADSFELNNTLGTAADIGAGGDVQATILPRGDHDFYRFEIAAPGEYPISVTNVPLELDIHYRVYNADGGVHRNWVAPLRAGAETIETVGFKEAGVYYIEITDGKDDARSIEPYTLRIGGATP